MGEGLSATHCVLISADSVSPGAGGEKLMQMRHLKEKAS